ncbi:MAG: tyrosine-protein phosphatase [Burkholderiales bacterium]
MSRPTDDPADPILAGAPNFRGVAPLPAGGGRRLRPRRIFRSDALHRLTDVDLATLARLQIGTVLDLRRDDERASMPTRWPDAVPRETLTFDVMPDLQAVRAGGWRVQLGAADFDADGAHRWMVDTYARRPGALGGAVREAARRLAGGAPAGGASAGGPPKTDAPAQTRLLVHCTAGKDRTGFVVAMLLAAVGVPREGILEDYLESGRRQPPEALARRLLATAPERPDARGLAAIETIASVRPEFLDAALHVVERDHGSVDRYLAACGVDGALCAALADALLD